LELAGLGFQRRISADDPALLAQFDCNQDTDNGIGVVAARRTSIGLSYGWWWVFDTEWHHHAGPRKRRSPTA
jgi:hypothetical protein